MKYDKDEIRRIAKEMILSDGVGNLQQADLCARVGMPRNSFDAGMGGNFQAFRDELRAEVGDGPAAPLRVKRDRSGLRKTDILRAAVDVARVQGYDRMQRADIADAAGVSPSLVTSYFNTMNQLRRDVMRHAVKERVLEVIAQGLVARDPHAQKADPDLQHRAMIHALQMPVVGVES